MLEHESASTDYLGPDHIHQLEYDLKNKLQKGNLSNKKRKKFLRILDRLERLRITKPNLDEEYFIPPNVDNGSTSFLPGGGTVFYYDHSE
jgi:hypothetical protein